MKPIFTIHAGEYLVGTYIEKHFKDCELWIPAKDTGVDLLITNKKDRRKNVSIQVKFSKDFLPEMDAVYHEKLSACGWWTLNPEKILSSTAEFWIIAPYSFSNKDIEFIIIEPKELYERLVAIHGSDKKSLTTYLWVSKKNQCIETRGLKKTDLGNLLDDFVIENEDRNFSKYLNNWSKIENILYGDINEKEK
ncbi:hypothetical protein [Fusibacter tunisiensis]|uniref:Uncharacterized protein n=1 Tax=Fusibacter tunisiensis TaxID=1008308 RepID=A0ABS2MSY6_9FIRM|nr:hypothetical protein [Fusibacter tunisiensis]MBM7562516.1 hypothetical protein [Fusibacter tunisiensis]